MPKMIKQKTYVDYKTAKPKNKPYKIFDGGGLALCVRPSGQKTWQFDYTFGEKRNTITIGYFDTTDLKDARKLRNELRANILKGIAPKNENKESEVITFEFVANDWLSRQQWVDGHQKRVTGFLKNYILPSIGKKAINDISSTDIKIMIDTLEKQRKFGVAKELVQRCDQIFGYARRNFSYTSDPSRDMGKDIPQIERVNRPHLKVDQIPEFLRKLSEYKGREYIKIGLNLLLLNFTRPSELRCATWDEFDLENATWEIPAKRMKMKKGHIVPLSRQSLDLLEQLKKVTRNSDFLFPSIQSADKPISDVTFLKALKIMEYMGDNKIVPHGFRHTASTILHDNMEVHGFSSLYIERQLAHVDKKTVRGVYNKAEYIDARCAMMQWYSDYIDSLKNTNIGSKK